jgi:hypothetical protein
MIFVPRNTVRPDTGTFVFTQVKSLSSPYPDALETTTKSGLALSNSAVSTKIWTHNVAPRLLALSTNTLGQTGTRNAENKELRSL